MGAGDEFGELERLVGDVVQALLVFSPTADGRPAEWAVHAPHAPSCSSCSARNCRAEKSGAWTPTPRSRRSGDAPRVMEQAWMAAYFGAEPRSNGADGRGQACWRTGRLNPAAGAVRLHAVADLGSSDDTSTQPCAIGRGECRLRGADDNKYTFLHTSSLDLDAHRAERLGVRVQPERRAFGACGIPSSPLPVRLEEQARGNRLLRNLHVPVDPEPEEVGPFVSCRPWCDAEYRAAEERPGIPPGGRASERAGIG